MKTEICEDDEDFVWRFSVPAFSDTGPRGDPLVEMVRLFMEDLLAIAFLTHKGERVSVDGFAFANNPAEIFTFFHDRSTFDAARQRESRVENPAVAAI
jgi:hypothetical protein